MVVANPERLKIKGIQEGLLVTLGEGDWPEVQGLLLNQIKEGAEFFKGARLALDIGNRVLHAAEMGTLRDKLSDAEVSLWAVISKSPVTEKTAKVLGLVTSLTSPKSSRIHNRVIESSQPGEEAILFNKTLRSGNKIICSGHVVVFGDVNPGAEIIADGNVIIWGRLKGSVHAGASGNADSMVCALEFYPTQLRIANFQLNISPKKKKIGPEISRVKREQIILEPWNLK
jgi:septum site-determining protein MinC